MTEQTPRIGVVVVAFNAATMLVDTLDRIPADFLADVEEVIILDDASSDDTYLHALAWAETHPGVTSVVVRHRKNLGYGGNQKAAYRLASERGLDLVVLLHGDGQYDPAYLPRLLEPLRAGEADAVFGSRMMIRGAARAGGMPMYKYAGNKILTKVQNRLLHADLSEFHSGYRAYSVAALDRLGLQRNSDDFDFDTQIIVQLLDQGMRIVEIPVPTYYGDEICYVNGMKYAADVVKDVLVYRAAKAGFGSEEWIATPAEYGFKEADGSSHARIIGMLSGRPSSRILDLGCSGGLLAERLRAQGHHVTGVDVDEVPGVLDRTDRFLVADLTLGLPSDLDGQYDVVIAGDVLEHLVDPARLMREVAAQLAPGGELIVSVPNVAHWYPRTRMALGLFGYDRRGPLDSTHLRFFTKRTLRAFVARTGFDVVEEDSTPVPVNVVTRRRGPVLGLAERVESGLRRARPQLFAYQFILRLRPHAEGMEMSVFSGATTPVEVPLPHRLPA